jgi:hypothetical protein
MDIFTGYAIDVSDGITLNANNLITPRGYNIGTTSNLAGTYNADLTLGDSNGLFVVFGVHHSGSVVNDGGLSLAVRIINSSDSILLSDNVIIASFSSSGTLTLPSSAPEGIEYVFRRVDGTSATVTVFSTSTDISNNTSTGTSSLLTIAESSRFFRRNSLWHVRTDF